MVVLSSSKESGVKRATDKLRYTHTERIVIDVDTDRSSAKSTKMESYVKLALELQTAAITIAKFLKHCC